MAISTQQLVPHNLWQEINPWNLTAGQFGFINVYNESSDDHDLELSIVHYAAGYGRQLGRMAEVVEVLLDLVKKDPKLIDSLDAKSMSVIKDFEETQAKVNSVKKLFGRSDKATSR